MVMLVIRIVMYLCIKFFSDLQWWFMNLPVVIFRQPFQSALLLHDVQQCSSFGLRAIAHVDMVGLAECGTPFYERTYLGKNTKMLSR